MQKTTQLSRMRLIRKSRTLSQEQLAAIVGCDQTTISRAEQGQLPSLAVQERIAAILGASRRELFDVEEATA